MQHQHPRKIDTRGRQRRRIGDMRGRDPEYPARLALTQFRHGGQHQAQFSDTVQSTDHFSDGATWPATYQPLQIRPVRRHARRPLIIQTPPQVPGMIVQQGVDGGFMYGWIHKLPPIRSSPTTTPSIVRLSRCKSTEIGEKSGFSGSSQTCLPSRFQRLTVTSPLTRATTI